MKKIMFVFFLIVSVRLHGQVNTYFDNNPVWKIIHACSAYPCLEYDNYNYYLNGDTILDTFVYKQVYRRGTIGYSWIAPPPNLGCPGGHDYADTVPAFFIRSYGKEVFVRWPANNYESQYYDFDLEVGDTLPFLTPNLSWDELIVYAMDSINTPNGYLRIFYVNGESLNTYFIEGVGHEWGLVEPLGESIDCGGTLQCYELNGSAYFPSPGPTCYMNIGIEKWDEINMKVYPNPVDEECKIELESELDNATLSLINMQGRVAKTMSNLNGNNILMNRGNLPPGMYLLKLEENGRIVFKKIVLK